MLSLLVKIRVRTLNFEGRLSISPLKLFKPTTNNIFFIGGEFASCRHDGHYSVPRTDMVKDTHQGQPLSYKEILTVDSAQGQEFPIVFLLLTKPSGNHLISGFNSDRLNIAMRSRSLGNYRESWKKTHNVQDWMMMQGKVRFLWELLDDFVVKGSVLR